MPALRPTVALLILAATWLACSGIRVDSDYDPSADFSQLRTWSWLPQTRESGDPRLDNALLDSRIRNAVEAELRAKGFERVDSGASNFQVVYHVNVEGKVDVDTVYRGYPHGRYGRYGYRGGGYSETTVRQYDEGTLLIDFLDPDSGALLWRGSGQATVRESSSPEQRTKRVNEAVNKILAQFPPKP
jgi:hypothetical protein